MANRFLYVYRTARDDGLEYAVGEHWPARPADGGIALFQRRGDALTFVYAVQANDGAMVHVLPSAES